MKSVVTGVLLVLMSYFLFITGANSESKTVLVNGIYLVTREAASEAELKPVDEDSEKMLVNDYSFFEDSERQKPVYLVIKKSPFVPILLKNKPELAKDKEGKPKLLIALKDSQVKNLAEFTTTNKGKEIAIVIGGKVVSCHKIKEPIEGGKIQFTRCTDNGCQVIYSELIKNEES